MGMGQGRQWKLPAVYCGEGKVEAVGIMYTSSLPELIKSPLPDPSESTCTGWKEGGKMLIKE